MNINLSCFLLEFKSIRILGSMHYCEVLSMYMISKNKIVKVLIGVGFRRIILVELPVRVCSKRRNMMIIILTIKKQTNSKTVAKFSELK